MNKNKEHHSFSFPLIMPLLKILMVFHCLNCYKILSNSRRKFCSSKCSYTKMNHDRKKNGYYKKYYTNPDNLKQLCKSVRKSQV